MTTYVVLLPGDESVWENASAEMRAAMYARHEEFAKALADRGHTITGGAELTHSRTTKQVRAGLDRTVVVTDGPYAETTEQLTGFYVVESDDVDDLLEVCAILATAQDGAGDSTPIEVRATVDHGSDGSGQ